MFLTIIVFIIVLGVLILVHELGHFIVAKITGVKVEEFAIGFPPRLFTYRRGETNYSINAIPLGGYVKMLGELEHSKDSRAFENKKPSIRFWISIAGVLMNLLLAWLILTIGFAVGMSPIVSAPESLPGNKISEEIIVADVMSGSPAAQADLKQKDVIKNIIDSSGKTTSFNSMREFTDYTASHKGQKITLDVKRGDKELAKEVTISDKDNAPLGVAVIERALVRVPWYKAPYVALRETIQVLKLTFRFLGTMVATLFTTGKVSEGVGGPVAIYAYTGLAVKAGLMVILQFIAILSINLALINILPFPALDGGRLVFILLEKIFRRRVLRESVENVIHTVGFAVLIILMVLITYHDIVMRIHR